jgi:hypothetical protein
VIIFFERPSEAYQERKNANAKQNHSDRSLVIDGNLHYRANQNRWEAKIQVRSLEGKR